MDEAPRARVGLVHGFDEPPVSVVWVKFEPDAADQIAVN